VEREARDIAFFQGVPYRVSYRAVKYPRLEFLTGVLHVILPYGAEVQEILRKKRRWILEKYRMIQRSQREASQLPLVDRPYADFKRLIQRFVQEAEDAFAVQVPRVQIRRMRTKWGSCSRRGTITLNALARGLPDDLLRYLVFHEVTHRRYWRHTPAFWKVLARHFPKPEEYEERLLLYWFRIFGETIPTSDPTRDPDPAPSRGLQRGCKIQGSEEGWR